MGLNELCVKYGTDKSSELHNYAEKYEMYFSPLKDKDLKLFEVGIQNGFSLKTWEEYFTKAKIYGIDLKDCSSMNTDRIKTIVCNQHDTKTLTKINETHGGFDIVIDDGSHFSSDMRTTFNHMFPLLNEGGLYVVEDMHCCYWDNFSKGDTSFMDRMKELLDIINSNGKCGLAELNNINEDHHYQTNEKNGNGLTWWEKNVEYIHMYKSIIFIKKR